ncbi:hypothetical protein B0H19DRAFT_1182263 [Mycena capillaripes]|nr:hypothetical protein B0H19DRAFT_1182263 [Mycena capillaripes]
MLFSRPLILASAPFVNQAHATPLDSDKSIPARLHLHVHWHHLRRCAQLGVCLRHKSSAICPSSSVGISSASSPFAISSRPPFCSCV